MKKNLKELHQQTRIGLHLELGLISVKWLTLQQNLPELYVIDVRFEYKLLDLKKEWNNLKTCLRMF